MTPLPRVTINRWDELLEEFDPLKGWLFRGHCSANWQLRSTLERQNPPGDNPVETEVDLFREFQRTAHHYVDAAQIPTTPGDWLALMHHVGAPTRLVEFTASPFVAAFFAFEEIPPDDSTHCAVIAIRPEWCQEQIGRTAFDKGGLFGFRIDVIKTAVLGMKSGGWESAPKEFAAGSLMAAHIEHHALEDVGDVLAVFEPNRVSERMAVQQSAFLWPGRVDKPIGAILDELGDLREGVCEFVMPISQRPRAIEQLRRMNITRASLFRGVDGFARSFKYLAPRESEKSRALRAAIRGLNKS